MGILGSLWKMFANLKKGKKKILSKSPLNNRKSSRNLQNSLEVVIDICKTFRKSLESVQNGRKVSRNVEIFRISWEIFRNDRQFSKGVTVLLTSYTISVIQRQELMKDATDV